MKNTLGLLLMGMVLFCGHAKAEVLYQTDFGDPPFVDGTDTWAGTDGWVSTDVSSGVQGITSGGAYLGFNVPASDQTWVWYTFAYDPVAEGNPIVIMQMDLTIVDSTTANYDDFRVIIYNDSVDFLATIDFYNPNLGIYRGDGTSLTYTGVDFVNSVTETLTIEINFASNLWTASWGASPLFADEQFNATGADLNLGELDFYWEILTPGSPGDNFLLVDNLSVQAVPEPSAIALFGLGLGLLAVRRRCRAVRVA